MFISRYARDVDPYVICIYSFLPDMTGDNHMHAHLLLSSAFICFGYVCIRVGHACMQAINAIFVEWQVYCQQGTRIHSIFYGGDFEIRYAEPVFQMWGLYAHVCDSV